jgi:ParB family chromosome partitioning protein
MKIQDIELKKILVTENVRLSKGDTEIKQLMESIKQHGLKEPIGVSVKGDRFLLLYGFRRYEAYKKLGYVTIPAVMEGKIDVADHLVINAIENIQRRDVTPYELGRICVKLIKLGLNKSEIAARLNTTKSRVEGAISVHGKLPMKFRTKTAFLTPGKIQKGLMSAQVAFSAIQISKEASLSGKELNLLLEEAKKQELSGLELKNVAKLLRAGLSIKEAVKKNKDYHVLRIDITVSKDELGKRVKKDNISKQDLIRKILYGILPPLTKPDFIKFNMKEEE